MMLMVKRTSENIGTEANHILTQTLAVLTTSCLLFHQRAGPEKWGEARPPAFGLQGRTINQVGGGGGRYKAASSSLKLSM